MDNLFGVNYVLDDDFKANTSFDDSFKDIDSHLTYLMDYYKKKQVVIKDLVLIVYKNFNPKHLYNIKDNIYVFKGLLVNKTHLKFLIDIDGFCEYYNKQDTDQKVWYFKQKVKEKLGLDLICKVIEII